MDYGIFDFVTMYAQNVFPFSNDTLKSYLSINVPQIQSSTAEICTVSNENISCNSTGVTEFIQQGHCVIRFKVNVEIQADTQRITLYHLS